MASRRGRGRKQVMREERKGKKKNMKDFEELQLKSLLPKSRLIWIQS